MQDYEGAVEQYTAAIKKARNSLVVQDSEFLSEELGLAPEDAILGCATMFAVFQQKIASTRLGDLPCECGRTQVHHCSLRLDPFDSLLS